MARSTPISAAAPSTPCGAGQCGAVYLYSNTAGVFSLSQELTAAAPVDQADFGIGAVHVFAPLPIIAVPALGPVGMGVLAVLLAGAGAVLLRRRAVL